MDASAAFYNGVGDTSFRRCKRRDEGCRQEAAIRQSTHSQPFPRCTGAPDDVGQETTQLRTYDCVTRAAVAR